MSGHRGFSSWEARDQALLQRFLRYRGEERMQWSGWCGLWCMGYGLWVVVRGLPLTDLQVWSQSYLYVHTISYLPSHLPNQCRPNVMIRSIEATLGHQRQTSHVIMWTSLMHMKHYYHISPLDIVHTCRFCPLLQSTGPPPVVLYTAISPRGQNR